MKIAITGGTGFLGQQVIRRLVAASQDCRCWTRPASQRNALAGLAEQIEWVNGDLSDDREQMAAFVSGCDALVHAALDRPGKAFRGGEGDLETFAARNLLGSLRLFEAAKQAGLQRTIFISTCAVHEKILDDRPLDESHPLWPTTHYGAHKAALEAFVHSYGWGGDVSICSLRPCGIYGLAEPITSSKWFDVVKSIVHGESVDCQAGGKVVHVDDVARAIEILLKADGVHGQSYNCCDGYVSDWDVATLAKQLCGSDSQIRGATKTPKHQIATAKLAALGMHFGGPELVRETVSQLIDRIRDLEVV
jgi:nucleoside-diphosphate-sugar epimerase